jgi:hypothetical protein
MLPHRVAADGQSEHLAYFVARPCHTIPVRASGLKCPSLAVDLDRVHLDLPMAVGQADVGPEGDFPSTPCRVRFPI